MNDITKYLKQLLAICPEAEATIHCLSFAIAEEIDGWKRLVETIEETETK